MWILLLPANTYLSLVKENGKFSIILVRGERMDIGIKLKDAPITNCFEKAGAWDAMVTHQVRTGDSKKIDKEILTWVKNAYNYV